MHGTNNASTREPPNLPLALIRWKARQLVGRYGFTPSDREDLEQEITLHVLRRLHQFDPLRGQASTFFDRIIDRKIASIIQHRKRQRRDYRRHVDSNPRELDHRLGAHDQEKVDFHLDYAAAMENLPEELRTVCDRLMLLTVAELARLAQVERGLLRGQLRQLRRRFADAGLDVHL